MNELSDYSDIEEYVMNLPSYLPLKFPTNVKISVLLDADGYKDVYKNIHEIMSSGLAIQSLDLTNVNIDTIRFNECLVSVSLNEHKKNPIPNENITHPAINGIVDALGFIEALKKNYSIPQNILFCATVSRDLALSPYRIENFAFIERLT